MLDSSKKEQLVYKRSIKTNRPSCLVIITPLNKKGEKNNLKIKHQMSPAGDIDQEKEEIGATLKWGQNNFPGTPPKKEHPSPKTEEITGPDPTPHVTSISPKKYQRPYFKSSDMAIPTIQIKDRSGAITGVTSCCVFAKF